jgi:pyruvate dehydrogenase E1 component
MRGSSRWRTPSGITLAPEGGAHQSVGEPLTGLAQPGLAAFEPAYADELAVLLRWAFEEIQREDGQSVYFRLSTRPLEQPRRQIDPDLVVAIVAGAYWQREPGPRAELAIAYCGAVAPEALTAYEAIAEDIPQAGLLAITSPDRLHRDWRAAGARGETGVAERLLTALRPGAALVTVGDFHPATLSWLGAVAGNTIVPLGVDRFGQSGDIPDLYRAYGIDTEAILDAAARACLTALPRGTNPPHTRAFAATYQQREGLTGRP